MWGIGSYSSVATLQAANVPWTMDPVSTSIEATAGDLEITWTAPFANGEAITAYKIEVLDGTDLTTWS